ncbi:MAG: hypothetical protein KBF74_10360 [Ferruginibacter sp.]|nr:hypothetical protein [Ferruginibacter sp.]
MEEKELNEQESLSLISEMIQKAKSSFHESGTSAILWGSVVAFCGLVSFMQAQFSFNIGFNVWLLIFVAVIPQVYITIREKKKKFVKSHQAAATDNVWLVYAISLVAVLLYQNIVPSVSNKLVLNDGIQLLQKNIETGEMKNFYFFIPGMASIYLIIYAFPTIATGLINKFKPMIWGAVVCYALFVISLYTSFKYDMLMLGLAGIANWLIPGLILRDRYNKNIAC